MKKTLKPKIRHILVETNLILSEKEYYNLIKWQYLQFYGIFGLSQLNLHVSFAVDKLIVSCNNSEKDKLIFVLATINRANEVPVYFRAKMVSGTIKSLVKQ